MMGVTPGYSAQLKKTDCRVAQLRMRNVLVMTTAACAIAGLSACSPVPDLPPAPATPAPGTGYVSNLEPYRVQVGDVLAVRLMLNPELNEEVTVRPDGRISTTVARDELAYGRTIPELAAALTHDYSTDLRNPRLTVVVKSSPPLASMSAARSPCPASSLLSDPPSRCRRPSHELAASR